MIADSRDDGGLQPAPASAPRITSLRSSRALLERPHCAGNTPPPLLHSSAPLHEPPTTHHTAKTRFRQPNQCSWFINYGHRFLVHTWIYNGITAHNQRASDGPPTEKLRSCPEHFTDGSRTENGGPNGQTTDRYGLATDSRSAHTRTWNGLKMDSGHARRVTLPLQCIS